MKYGIYVLGLSIFISACSVYRPAAVCTIDIPLIKKDDHGLLRDALVTEIAKSPFMAYSADTGEYELRLEVVKDKTENVSFFYETDAKTGKATDKLVADEQMRTLVVKAALFSKRLNADVVAPFIVSARVDYNFANPSSLSNVQFTNLQGAQESLLQFSLGQLDSEEGAQSASYAPAYRRISEQVMAVLSHQLYREQESPSQRVANP